MAKYNYNDKKRTKLCVKLQEREINFLMSEALILGISLTQLVEDMIYNYKIDNNITLGA